MTDEDDKDKDDGDGGNYELIETSDPMVITRQTKKYDHIGGGVKATYMDVSRPACCPPRLKSKYIQVELHKIRERETSKYSPQGDKQNYRKKR